MDFMDLMDGMDWMDDLSGLMGTRRERITGECEDVTMGVSWGDIVSTESGLGESADFGRPLCRDPSSRKRYAATRRLDRGAKRASY